MPTGGVTLRDFKGVDFLSDPRSIADNMLANAANTFPYVPGQLNAVRDGVEVAAYTSVVGSPLDPNYPLVGVDTFQVQRSFLMELIDKNGGYHLLMWVGTAPAIPASGATTDTGPWIVELNPATGAAIYTWIPTNSLSAMAPLSCRPPASSSSSA